MEAAGLERGLGHRSDLIRLRVRAARPAVGKLGVAGVLATGGVLALGAASGPSVLVPPSLRGWPDWISGPLREIGPSLTVREWRYVFYLMLVCFAVALLCASAIGARLAIGAIVAAHLVFVLAPPLLSADIFSYVSYGRLGAVHGLNPYEYGALAAPQDPVLPFVDWRDVTDYGPVFILITYAVGPLGVAASLWTLKVLAALASLGCVALIWRIAQRLGRDPVAPALFFGLNPVVLVYAVGGGHNDLLMLVVTLGAIALALEGRERPAAAAFVVAGAGIKVLAAIPMAFWALRRNGVLRRSAALAVSLALLGAASLLIFGTALLEIFGSLEGRRDLVEPGSGPGRIAGAFGDGAISETLRYAFQSGGLIAIAALLARNWRTGDWIANAGWATLAALVTTSFLLFWYLVLLIALAALSSSRALKLVTLAFCSYAVLFPGIG